MTHYTQRATECVFFFLTPQPPEIQLFEQSYSCTGAQKKNMNMSLALIFWLPGKHIQ